MKKVLYGEFDIDEIEKKLYGVTDVQFPNLSINDKLTDKKPCDTCKTANATCANCTARLFWETLCLEKLKILENKEND